MKNKTLCILICGCALPLAAQIRYTPVDLGTLGGNGAGGGITCFAEDSAYGINRSGQVVGASIASDGYQHAFKTQPNQPMRPLLDDLGVLPGYPTHNTSIAFAINDAGQVAGYSAAQTGISGGCTFTSRGFRANPAAVMVDIGTLAPNGGVNGLNNVQALAISQGGEVAGFSDVAWPNNCSDISHGFRTFPNAPIDPVSSNLLTLYGCGNSEAFGVNPLGLTVGAADTTGSPSGWAPFVQHAFSHSFTCFPPVCITGGMTDLGSLGGPLVYSRAYAVNDLAQIVGESGKAQGQFPGQGHAFLLNNGQFLNQVSSKGDLGALPNYITSTASAINHGTEVVGWSSDANGNTHAFLYSGVNADSSGAIYDLNNLIPANSGWTLIQATGINDLGQIVGRGTHNGVNASFRLDPPEIFVAAGEAALYTQALGPFTTLTLLGKLEIAVILSQQNQPQAASQQINAFIQQVATLNSGGQLSQGHANSLYAIASHIIAVYGL